MQQICDGALTKRDVLDASIVQYQEVYVKARNDFNTIVDVSEPFLLCWHQS